MNALSPLSRNANKYAGKQGCLHYRFLGVFTPIDNSAPLATFSEYGDPKRIVFYSLKNLEMASSNFLKLGNEIQVTEFNEAVHQLTKA